MSEEVVRPDNPNRNRDSALFRRLLRNSARNYLSVFFNLTLGFLLTPFLLHRLGPVEFGLWVLILSSATYGTLFDFGIFGALTKFVAEHRATGQIAVARQYIAASSMLYWMIGLAVAVFAVIISPFFPAIFHVSDADHATAVRAVALAGIWVGLTIAC
ncbi:MAG: oligosaccharide flippase family protein, partial [Thermomicrobiales bacterium]